MLSASATRRRSIATAKASPQASSTAAVTARWSIVAATIAGLALGVVAALADRHGGTLSDLLSVPGPWIATAALVAVLAARAARRWAAPVTTAGFLLAGVAAYYLAKHTTMAGTPGPLVAFWGVLAVVVGVTGGALAAWCVDRPWGLAAVTGAVAGWLAVEALLLPAAPTGEALAGAVGAGIVGRGVGSRGRQPRAIAIGACVGATAATGVLAVLSRALTAAL